MNPMEEVDLSVQVAAGALFFDENLRFLFVEPTYRPEWNVPGGAILRSETPIEGCRREVKEEIGLSVTLGPFAVP